MRPRAGTLEIICCTLAWGTIGSIVNRISLASSVIVFFRLAIGFVVVLGWLAARKRLGDLRLNARPVLLISSGLVLGVHWALLFAAYKRIGVDTTILIVFIGPVLWAVAAPFFLRERLRVTSLGALAVAFGGIALISIPKIGTVDGLGLAAAFGSAVLFAVLILMGKLLTEHYEPAAIVVWQLGVAAVLLSPALAGASVRQIGRGLPLLLVLGMVHSGVLGIVFFHAVRALPTQELGVLFYLEPASAVLYAWWWLSEKPTALTLAGGALIVLAGIGIIVADRAVGGPGALPEPVMQEVPR
ncbi:MAG: DMT family transporter [Actinobacteria bacterium]|nr:MAG: DMT family transporter [Actinomycetota bacterium]